ncbi:hypothetical protein NL108_016203 [Boleophthalmus pectinirostris]|nr:hypothetical protein NL108_016203 [Boleophthalmus pectinirostris]
MGPKMSQASPSPRTPSPSAPACHPPPSRHAVPRPPACSGPSYRPRPLQETTPLQQTTPPPTNHTLSDKPRPLRSITSARRHHCLGPADGRRLTEAPSASECDAGSDFSPLGVCFRRTPQRPRRGSLRKRMVTRREHVVSEQLLRRRLYSRAPV